MRDYNIYLEDILEAASKIQNYVKEINSYEDLLSHEVIIDAVVRNLQIIGEAVKSLPLGLREKYPEIEWKKIAGFRDVVTHAYFGVDNRIVWDIIENKIYVLKEEIEKILIKERIIKQSRQKTKNKNFGNGNRNHAKHPRFIAVVV